MIKPPTDFTRYIGTSYEPWILPVLPVGATLKLKADGTPGLNASNLGKIPGKLLGNGNGAGQPAWVGFVDWPTHRAKKIDLERWQKWQTPELPVPICMRLDERPVLDFNVNRQDDLDELLDIVFQVIGKNSPIRTRPNSPRCAMFFKWEPRTPPVRKTAIKWTDEKGDDHGIDFLGIGCHTLVQGPHKSGVMHEWPAGDIVDWESNPGLPLVNAGTFAQVHGAVREWIEAKGYQRKTGPLPSGLARDLKTHPIGNPGIPNPLAVKPEQLELLARCVRAIDLKDDRLSDYSTFIGLLHAVKAACNGDEAFFANVFEPWVMSNPANAAHGEGYAQDKWNSITKAELGADHVFDWAAWCGDGEAIRVQAEREAGKALELFNGPTANTGTEIGGSGEDGAGGDSADGSGGAGTAALPAGGGGSGTGAFPWTDKACANQFAATHPNWRYSTDQGWVRLERGVYVTDEGVIHPISDMCSAIGDSFRPQGAQGQKIDQMMKSTHKAESVERMARRHPTLVARTEEFDADPWMLNTPDFVVDLRTGDTYPHGALLRNQTLVSPQWQASDHYETYCPRWLDFLHQICEDEQDIALLARHGGNGLVGTALDQLLLFIHGQGGTGKSAFSDIIHRLAGTYSKVGSSMMFQKQAEKRPFELGGTVGKRSLFVPETLKGMTWDEVLICDMLGGVEISAERKNVQPFTFRSVATITVTGNYLPRFVTNGGQNASGIDRRLLLLKVNKKIEESKIDVQFAEKLVAEEGPAIMMWFVHAAIEGWNSLQATGKFYGSTKDKAAASAASYKDRSNPYKGWMEETGIVVERGARMNAHDAFHSFKAWALEENPTFRETKTEFRDNIASCYPDAISYGRYGDERVFFGMRFANGVAGGNVFAFPKVAADVDRAAEGAEDAKTPK